MDIHAFTSTISKELGLTPYQVMVTEIPGMPEGMANAVINPLLKVIIVTPKAKGLLTEDELCAVITHELSHSYNNHMAKRIVVDGVSFVLSGINLFLPLPIWKKLLIQVGISATEIAIKWKMFHAQEFEADQLSFRYSLNQQLASALRKLEAVNKPLLPTNALVLALMSISHPSTEERIKRLSVPVITR
jgi:Zn-dependent protease with chaperone function